MTEYPRVLVGITTYKDKDYMLDNCYKAVLNFVYPSDKYDVIIVDNSNDKGRYANRLRRRGYKKVFHTLRGENSRQALTNSQNLIRRKLLEGDYEYLLFVESDLLPDKNLLQRLLNYGKKVVGSTYFIGTGNVKVPCIFLADVAIKGMGATRPLGLTRDPETGENKDYDPEEIKKFIGTGLRQVHGCGFGCTLIKREVLEDIKFWCDERFDNKHSDVYFYLDMERNNIPVFVDTDHVIPHYPSRWDLVEDK